MNAAKKKKLAAIDINSQHWLYPRWKAMNQRCYNPNAEDYEHYGAYGVKVDDEWHRDNPLGLENFIEWVETQVKLRGLGQDFYLCRYHSEQDFGPLTCKLVKKIDTQMKRVKHELKESDVIRMRNMVRLNPTISSTVLVKKFGTCQGTVHRAITGVTWKYLNERCPPAHFDRYSKKVVKNAKTRKPNATQRSCQAQSS